MKTINRNRAIFATAMALAACMGMALFAWGCGGGASREKIERVDEAFRAGASRMAETTAFVAALEEFDFENAGFLEDTLDALDRSRDAARAVLASVAELRGLSYEGDLAALGEYVDEYSTAAVESVEELEGIFAGLQGILRAIEPILREEAVITQLEAPRSAAEWLERLRRLEAALDASLPELVEVEAPLPLEEYGTLFAEMLSILRKLVGDLIAVVTGQAPNVNMEENPDFLRMQELMAGYIPCVESLYESLKITGIDPLVEKVELEINDLYMGM